MQVLSAEFDDRLVHLSLSPYIDERGLFCRLFCEKTLASLGISFNPVQSNLSLSHTKGTLRGMHYQLPPYRETKLVTCLGGSLLDVVVDIDPSSPTYLQYKSFVLSSDQPTLLCIPKGFAHGFQALEDHTSLLYFVDAPYSPQHESGVLYNDPAIGIRWPLEPTSISAKDLNHPAIKQ